MMLSACWIEQAHWMFYIMVWFIVALACTQYDSRHWYLFDIQGTLETMALHVSCYLEEEVFLNNIFGTTPLCCICGSNQIETVERTTINLEIRPSKTINGT